mmetsp:Transcript_30444/g.48816  ORF Transcript_30444/g.48816 Transcript_30444/m.48816 type:complete len:311 (+) Transcript_30444:294-1226(+)
MRWNILCLLLATHFALFRKFGIPHCAMRTLPLSRCVGGQWDLVERILISFILHINLRVVDHNKRRSASGGFINARFLKRMQRFAQFLQCILARILLLILFAFINIIIITVFLLLLFNLSLWNIAIGSHFRVTALVFIVLLLLIVIVVIIIRVMHVNRAIIVWIHRMHVSQIQHGQRLWLLLLYLHRNERFQHLRLLDLLLLRHGLFALRHVDLLNILVVGVWILIVSPEYVVELVLEHIVELKQLVVHRQRIRLVGILRVVPLQRELVVHIVLLKRIKQRRAQSVDSKHEILQIVAHRLHLEHSEHALRH